MIGIRPGELKSKKEQIRLLVEKLERLDGTGELIDDVKRGYIYSAVSKATTLELSEHMMNKITRLRWQA